MTGEAIFKAQRAFGQLYAELELPAANQFAALPSLHIGWLSLVGWGMWTSLRRFWGVFFAIVPATVMMVAVVATGNHFWLDGVFGAALCLGAVAATWLAKARPKTHDMYTVPVSSGIIAGESLMGVLIGLLTVAGVLS